MSILLPAFVLEEHALFVDICRELELGPLVARPARVSGGFLHKMYRLQAGQRAFAVKLLNPMIMKRSGAFDNYKTAEALELKLQAAGVPIVPILEFHNKKMQCIRGQYFYVFDWIDGNALKSEEIQREHCVAAGAILAKIHKLEQKQVVYCKPALTIDWDFYIQQAARDCPELAALLAENKGLLYASQREGNSAHQRLPGVLCICNGDMDSKNVLWAGNDPHLIDLECLNYGNPYLELFELALCWSGYEHCCVCYDLLEAFIRAYIREYGALRVDWSVLYCSNNGRLEWLEYNLKRALLLECGSEEERLLGIEQVKETIRHILYYSKIRAPLLKQLAKLFGESLTSWG